MLVLQKDAEDLRVQLQSVRGEITSVTQRADAERSECQAKLYRMQSEADNRVCPDCPLFLRMWHIATATIQQFGLLWSSLCTACGAN